MTATAWGRRRLPLGLLLAGLGGADAAAQNLSASDALLGDVGAAYSSPVGAEANPANAAFVDRTQIFFEPELLKQESLSVRYPGFDSTVRDTSGLGSFLSLPAVVVKPTSRFGFGGFALPPGVGTQIQQNRIPVVILGQQSYVDLVANGKLQGAAQLFAGYRVSDRIGIGVNVAYQAIAFTATLTPSGGGATLATVSGDLDSTDINVGIRLDPVPGRFAMGVSADVMSIQKTDMNVQSPLLGSLGGGAAGGSGAAPAGGTAPGGAGGQVTIPFAQVHGGVMLALLDRARIMVDAVYTRVDKTQAGFSLVNLKQEPKDVHDTLGGRAGAIIRVTDAANGLLGFRYEPASVGAGSKADGLVGFGTTDLVMIETGFAPLTPYYQASVGLQMGFSPREAPRQKGSHTAARGYYQWTVETGVVYRYASLGIDENGELPGAYLYKKTSVPLGVTYKF